MAEPGSLRRRVLQGFSLVILGDLIARGLGYLLLPVYLHVMSKPQVGLFTNLQAYTGLISQVAMLGLYAALSKLHGEFRQRGEERRLAGLVLAAALVPTLLLSGALACWPGMLGILVSDPVSLAKVGPLVPLGVVSGVLAFLYTNFLVVTGRYRLATVFAVVRAVAGNAVALALFSAAAIDPADQARDRLVVVWGVDLAAFLGFAFHYVRHLDFRWRDLLPTAGGLARRLGAISFPVWLNLVPAIPMMVFDRALLDRIPRGQEALADYNTALMLAGAVAMVFSSFNQVWLPAVLSRTDPAAVLASTWRVIPRAVTALAAVGLALAASVWLMLILGLWPATYAPVLALLGPLIAVQVLNAVVHLLGIPFYALERTWVLPAVNVPVTVVFVAGCWWLIPTGGAWAAAWLQLLSPVLVTAIYLAVILATPRLRQGTARG